MMVSSKKESLGRRFFKNSLPLSASQNKLLNTLLDVTLVGTVFSMILLLVYAIIAFTSKHYGSEAFDWLLGIFSDFVFIMNTSLEESPYIVENSSYPPAAIIILLPFALICKKPFSLYSGETFAHIDELNSRMLLHPEFWVSIVLFFIITSALVILLVIKKYRLDPISSLKVALIILFSSPFVFAIMRGNTIYFALIFLLVFLMLYDSEKPYLREIAYFSLALAGAIKIYPLFFGVFLLNKKKIFASLRVAVYFFALNALSFLCFNGGFGDIDSFIENLSGFASNNLRLLAGNNLSLSSIVYRCFYPFSPEFANGSFVAGFMLGITLSLFLCSALTATVTRSTFSRMLIAAATVILVPSISYFYVLIFMLLPLMEFIKGFDSFTISERRFYTVLFTFIFFTPAVLPQYYIVHSLLVISALFYEYRKVIRGELIPLIAKKKIAQAK